MVILFPMLWGLMIWSQLPNQIPIHFNFAGQANNFQSKPLVVFGLPIFDLMVHLFMIFMIGRDSKNSAMNEKMIRAIYWLTPIVSFSTSYLIYSKALGSTTNPSVFVSVLLGLIFVIMGNYMPKLKVNLWVLGGLILLLEAGLQFALSYVLALVILAIVLIPVMYSYQLSRKNR